MELLKKYSLLPSQKEFLEIPHNFKTDIAVYQGGYGSGKTFSGSLLGILLARKIAGIRGIVGALTFPVVRDTTLVSYFEHLDFMGYKKGVHFEFNKVEAKLVFKNGSEILFRYFEDAHKLKSLNIGFAQIEEMSDVPESSFNMLLSRLRQANVPRFRLFGHTNPENSKGWIYKHFVENPKPNYRLIIAPSTQNTNLPEGFIDNLKQSYDPEYYRINVLGEFGDYTKGLVTKGFTSANVYDSCYIDKIPLHLTCDFNVDPMCWIIAHKTSDKVFFIDELAVENTNTQECILEFLRRYPSHKAKIIINGDASGDNRSSSSEFTNYAIIRNALYKHGYKDVDFHLRSFNPPIKNRVASWNAKIANAKGERTVLVSNKCEKLLHNIYNLKYKEGTSMLDLPTIQSIKSNRNVKFLGHPFDAASYLTEFYWPVKLV